MKYTANEIAIILLDSIIDIEYKHKYAILELVEQKKDIVNMPSQIKQYMEENLTQEQIAHISSAFNKDYLYEVFAMFESLGLVCITYISSGYSSELLQISTPPLVLYCKGNTKLLELQNKVAIVGSRKTPVFYQNATTEIAKTLTANEVVVVTGLAEGGDTSAIGGGLPSGLVISVLAFGHNYVYPETNCHLLEKINNEALSISEYFPTVKPVKYNFPIRNRIIAGLAKGVLVVSGSKISGTRHTVNYALEYNKEVFALPYEMLSAQGQYCNSLIKQGAVLVESGEEILEQLGIEIKAQSKLIEVSSDEEKIIKIIEDGNNHIEALLEKSQLPIYVIMPILTGLEIKGVLVKEPNNYYGLANRNIKK